MDKEVIVLDDFDWVNIFYWEILNF
jgi:hypothetical protein